MVGAAGSQGMTQIPPVAATAAFQASERRLDVLLASEEAAHRPASTWAGYGPAR